MLLRLRVETLAVESLPVEALTAARLTVPTLVAGKGRRMSRPLVNFGPVAILRRGGVAARLAVLGRATITPPLIWPAVLSGRRGVPGIFRLMPVLTLRISLPFRLPRCDANGHRQQNEHRSSKPE